MCTSEYISTRYEYQDILKDFLKTSKVALMGVGIIILQNMDKIYKIY